MLVVNNHRIRTVSFVGDISCFSYHIYSLAFLLTGLYSAEITTDACKANWLLPQPSPYSYDFLHKSCCHCSFQFAGRQTRKVSYYILGGNIRALLHDGSNCKPQTVGYMYLKLQFFRVIYTRMWIQPFVRAHPWNFQEITSIKIKSLLENKMVASSNTPKNRAWMI